MTRSRLTGAFVMLLTLTAPLVAVADTGYSNLFAIDLREGTAPTAAFTWSPSSPTAGQSVRFTDTSTGDPTTWSWSLGDGSSSSTRNPSHTYSSAGTYTVRLTVSNSYGSDSVSHSISVGGTVPSMVFFDDFHYDCVDGCGDALRNQLWHVVGGNFLSVDSASGILEFHLPAGTEGAGSGTGNSPQIYTRKSFDGGLYAARVFFDDSPRGRQDPVVETFWAQSMSIWGEDSRYAEVDFEYLPHDFWNGNTSARKPTMYMTSWAQAVPRLSDQTEYDDQTLGGRWIGLMMKVVPEAYVEYSLFDEQGRPMGSSPYRIDSVANTPDVDSSMHLFFEVWAQRPENSDDPAIVLSGDTTMDVDWVLMIQDAVALEYSWADVESLVTDLAGNGPVDTTVNVEEPPGGQCSVEPGTTTEVSEVIETLEEVLSAVWSFLFGEGAKSAKTTGCEILVTIRNPNGVIAEQTTCEPGGAYDVLVSGPAGRWTVQFEASGCTDAVDVDYEVLEQHQDGGQPPTFEISAAGAMQYVIPASAHADGLAQTVWSTDLTVHNPNDEGVSMQAYFLASGHDNSGVGGVNLRMDSGASMDIGDLVLTLFGESSAAGAILVGSDEPLVITSRTYNNAEDGTYGQYVPGLPAVTALAQGDEVRLIQLTRNDSYRTNIGFANAGGERITVDVDLYRAGGQRIGQQAYTVEPYGYYQRTDIIGVDVDDAYAVVSSSSPGAAYFTYASVVDNGSGDPVLILPVATSTGEPLYVPASAHVGGAAGTDWRTDLEVHNPGSTGASFTVELLRQDQANPSPSAVSFDLDAGRSVRYRDVLQSVFGFSGAAALRVSPTRGSIMVTSRTYNDVAGGTYGQFIPAVTTATAAVSPGQEGRLIQLSRSASASRGYRTNIGFVNAGASSVTVEVEMFTGDGVRLGARSYTLAPYEYDQANDILGEVTGDDVGNGFAVVTTATAGGTFFAYASVVDNRSGDPVYVPAQGL